MTLKTVREEEIDYKGNQGIPVIKQTGNSAGRKTGDWKVYKPIIDAKECRKCKICWLFCPENAIEWKNGPKIDDNLCKGCLICVNECPVKCIRIKRVSEALE